VEDQRKKRQQLLSPEEKEFLGWLLDLPEIEYQILCQSMDRDDWLDVLHMMYQWRDEVISDWMDEHGTPDADLIVCKILEDIRK
jgi:hypothetical protein